MRQELIVWMDSGFHITDEGWQPIEKLMKRWKPTDMETVTSGVVAYEDDDVVVLSSTWSPATDAFFDAQIIWKKSILTREVLHNDVDQFLSDRQYADRILRNLQEGDDGDGPRNGRDDH